MDAYDDNSEISGQVENAMNIDQGVHLLEASNESTTVKTYPERKRSGLMAKQVRCGETSMETSMNRCFFADIRCFCHITNLRETVRNACKQKMCL